MGRTKRKRTRNRLNPPQQQNPNIGHNPTSINLQKWLKRNSFLNPFNYQLRNFLETGRGVTSPRSIRPLDVLVRIPLNLLITFDTIRKSELIEYLNVEEKSLNIQTLLTLFLVMEKHKGTQSEWKNYIDSLPCPEPTLPWTCKQEDIEFYPEELRVKALRLRNSFEECVNMLKVSFRPGASCRCCGKSIDYLLDTQSFRWAYVLVNTRAVYVDPTFLMSKDNSHQSLLSDDPSLALCPYMDLFNHHYTARTKANIVSIRGQYFYQLTTMTGFKKYQQFFISYGAHSNEKLFMEYGFFIPGNVFDFVRINLREVIEILKMSLEERQYKYIKNYEFDEDEVYVNQNGLSFVLKAILFVCYHPGISNYASYIFSNKYPTEFDSIVRMSTKKLLEFKLHMCQKDIEELKLKNLGQVHGFLDYREQYILRLLQLLEENMLCFS
ncbi:SET domain-containing protein 4 [Euwallacea fornicatus]|uniref:SET domain-containing protein 4 n=1 Tax=Euwallacea fornicatus TaxID=995702 RepID=UPI00338EB3B1